MTARRRPAPASPRRAAASRRSMTFWPRGRGWPGHQPGLGGLAAQRQRGQGLGAEVDRQDLQHGQRQRDRAAGQGEDAGTARPRARRGRRCRGRTCGRCRRPGGPPRRRRRSVAKLSSVSTMVAASRATSVPLRPMATPMSARRSAGASLTPSPVIATTWPSCAQRVGDAQLGLRELRGRRRAPRPGRADASSSASDSASSSRAVDDRGRRAMPTRRAISAGGAPVVAGDDVDADAGAHGTRRRRRRTSGRGGSSSPTRPSSVRPGPSASSRSGAAGRCPVPPGDGQHPQPAAGRGPRAAVVDRRLGPRGASVAARAAAPPVRP